MKKALAIVLAFVLIAAVWTPFASAQTFDEDLPRPVLPNGIPEENLAPVPDQQSEEEILLVEDELLRGEERVFFGSEEGAPGELIISVQEREPQGTATRTWDVSVEGGYSAVFLSVLHGPADVHRRKMDVLFPGAAVVQRQQLLQLYLSV